MPTYSAELELGMPCPDFELPSVDGKKYRRDNFEESELLLVTFLCGHCPYVQAVEKRILRLAGEYESKKLQVVAISSNDASLYPEDSPKALLKRWQEKGYGFPYLVDESQAVAHAFDAQCTPEFYLFDKARKLVYHGRLDDNWKDEGAVTRQELKEAIDLALRRKEVPVTQNPSMGCSIKWKKD
jgi:peroxiredoxin